MSALKITTLPQVGLLVAGEEAVLASLQEGEGLVVKAGIPCLTWKMAGQVACEFFCEWEEALAKASSLGLSRVWEVRQVWR